MGCYSEMDSIPHERRIMKTKICILFFISTLIISCIKHDEVINIQPKIHIVGDIIGIEYRLYRWNILDEIRGASSMMVKYFEDNKDDLNLRLHIYVNEAQKSTVYFTYYIGGVKICTNKNILSLNDIKIVQRDLRNGEPTEKTVKDNPSPSIEPVEQNEKKSL